MISIITLTSHAWGADQRVGPKINSELLLAVDQESGLPLQTLYQAIVQRDRAATAAACSYLNSSTLGVVAELYSEKINAEKKRCSHSRENLESCSNSWRALSKEFEAIKQTAHINPAGHIPEKLAAATKMLAAHLMYGVLDKRFEKIKRTCRTKFSPQCQAEREQLFSVAMVAHDLVMLTSHPSDKPDSRQLIARINHLIGNSP